VGKRLTFILGGARSGKSTHAQQMAEEAARAAGSTALYVATAVAFDDEMRTRILNHQADRGENWRTLEAPRKVGEAIRAKPQPAGVVLLDCLTLLANNVLLELPEPVDETQAEAEMAREMDDLLAAYRESSAEWIVVSNEVGLGIVPAYPLGRIYRDVLGRANQRMASAADQVIFMVAGLPMTVK
jgi:adenosylcobinamide kinase / adenosylcobinamide-phosphate guanylyltransferase